MSRRTSSSPKPAWPNALAVALCGCVALSAACSDDPAVGNAANVGGPGNDGGLQLSDGFSFGDGGGVSTGADGSASDQPVNTGECEFQPKPDSGQPGAACDQPADCDSGLCVEGPEGKICTRVCIECCPNGFKCEQWKKTDADFICLPKLAALCRPCHDDGECAAINPGALCIASGSDGAFCGGACAQNSDCPADYACEMAKGSQGEALQCVRKTGACGCSVKAVADGAATWCQVSNDVGTCKGERKCTSSGLGACDAPVSPPYRAGAPSVGQRPP